MHTPNEFPTALKDLFIHRYEIHGYITRNKYDLHATHVNTKIYGHKKLSYVTRQCWNSLDFQLKREQSLKKFQNMHKENILTGFEKY